MKKAFLLLLLVLGVSGGRSPSLSFNPMGTMAFAADVPSSGVSSQSSGLAALKPAMSGVPETRAEDNSIESLINPFIDVTRQQGAARLAGRYAHVKAIPSRAGGGNVLAPTSIIMEIGQDGAGAMNVAGGDATRIQVSFDAQANIPTLTTAYADDPNEAPMTDLAVLVPQGNRYIWRLVSTQSGNLRLLYPLTADWFPAGYLEGAWQGDDGSSLTFQNGQLSANGQAVGTYTLSDNRVSVAMANGGSDLLFTAYDPDSGLLVVTFNGADPENWNAMSYRRAGQPQPKPQPKPKPQPFPPFPPTQQVSLDGVWGAVLPNGVQAVIQIQGNQYWGWINGQPSESGIFQIQGNVMQGQTSTGTSFVNQFQCDGRTLVMTFQNGSSIIYQRMQ